MSDVVAPGKVILAGEYAVLEGHGALVMAVDRYAHAVGVRAQASGSSLPPEAVATLAMARERGMIAMDATARVDGAAFVEGGRKLGLGSSAAQCVAALGAAMRASGHSLEDRHGEIAIVAREGHARAQGGGSGLDVIASTYGGVRAVRFPRGVSGDAETESIEWPDGLAWRVLWTGVPVRTSDQLRSVRAFAARDRAGFDRRMREIGDAAEQLTRALRAQTVPSALAAVRAHCDAMDALGRASETSIVTEPMRQLALRAEPLGAAVKPSGAGGGDIVLVLAHDHAVLDEVTVTARDLGFTPLALRIDRGGVRARGETS